MKKGKFFLLMVFFFLGLGLYLHARDPFFIDEASCIENFPDKFTLLGIGLGQKGRYALLVMSNKKYCIVDKGMISGYMLRIINDNSIELIRGDKKIRIFLQ